MAKLFFSIHQHQPRLLNTVPAGPESYVHDDGVTYLVLQPFVLEPTQGPAAGDQMMARDYLRTWSAAKLASEGIYLIGADEVKLIAAGVVEPCPVPLPPGTRLSLTLEAQTVSGVAVNWSDDRPIGLQNPPVIGQWDQLSGDAASGWPAFAVLSSALPPVRAWADLDGGAPKGPQKDAAVLGLLTTFSRMAAIWAATDPTRTDDRDLVWSEIVKPLLKPAPPKKPTPLDDVDAWVAHLNKRRSGGTNGSWAYDLLMAVSLRDPPLMPIEPVISLPGFQWTADGVRTRPDLFLGSGQAEQGYADALWNELRGLAEREANAARQVDLPINQMLGRLFGFGERLAWPVRRVDGNVGSSKRFMVLREDLSHVSGIPPWIDTKDWLATNVVSLAGLVLRLPWNVADPIEKVTDCEFRICGRVVSQLSGTLTELLDSSFAEIRNIPARTLCLAKAEFGGPLGEQPIPSAKPDRIVFYAARKAPMLRLEGHTPFNRALFAVPEALLDVVDSGQRFIDRDSKGNLVRNAARRALFRHELLNVGEILPPTVDGVAVHAWHRRQIELTPRVLTASSGIAYALRHLEAIHDDEALVGTWIDNLASGTGYPEAWLWVPVRERERGKGGELRLSAAVLARDADGATLVLDYDPKAAGSLSEVLGYDPAQPKAFGVELAFRTTTEASGIFDIVEWPTGASVKPPDLILAKAPLTRLSRSADRLAGAIAVTWPVPFDPDYGTRNLAHPDMQAVHCAESNKLRLKLALPAGRMMRNLSDPDAQLPLPAIPPQLPDGAPGPNRPWTKGGAVSAAGPQAWYWFAEHFDQDTALDNDAEEETRFQLWNTPGTTIKVSGYLEHQQGHRLGLDFPDVVFRRTVDVVNPADITVPERENASTATAVNRRQPLLQLVEDRQAGVPSMLRVLVRREPLKVAIGLYSGGSPGQLRSIYRSLAELRDCIASGGVEIVVESWIYDNTRVIGSGAFATLGLGMRPASEAAVPLADLQRNDLEKLLTALDGTFEDFIGICGKIAGGIGPLAVLYEAKSSDFDKAASMIRVRLTLTRPAAVRAETDWADGAFIPLADKGPEAGSALADTAQKDLANYLSDADSRLAKSVAWVETNDTVASEKGMGPGATKFLVPEGETAPVTRVADMFYLPHAFILPEAHPLLRDRGATADFLSFVLRLVEDLLAGRSIDDRINLTDTLSAAEAVAHRRILRGILENGTDGAVARMMRLFRRVDTPSASAGATPAEQLHWHAGEVLESLSTLANSPQASMRKRLLDAPSLFSSLRAVGIAFFNRKLPRAPDPAAAVNHSTFSPELIEIGITKHLIDDTDRVKEDADRFAASAFEGGTLAGDPAYYVIDLLPDHFYDDLVEIRPNTYRGVDPLKGDLFGLPRDISEIDQVGDATARRGEDVLYPQSKPSLATNIVHIFPDWRVVEDRAPKPKQLRTYYLLPERLPPPRARSVDALQGDILCNRTEISLDFTGAGNTPQISPNAKWAGQYANEVQGKLGAVTVAAAKGPAKNYQRILKAANPTGPARYLPSIVAAAGPQTEGWHLLTTYLSHFWFELDLQKPGESWSVNLEDDTYEIEIEMWNGTPPPSEDTPIEPPASDDILLRAFRRLRQSAQVTPPPLPDITRAKLEDGVQAWLQTGRDGQTLLELPKTLDERRQDASLRTFRVTRPVGDGAWTLTETTKVVPTVTASPGIGAVVAFEVLARGPQGAPAGPRYDDAVPIDASVLLRVSVLDTPAMVSRARLRVVRNWRDAGNDGIPDIAPEFFLAERFSTWKSEGRAPIIIDEQDFNRGHVPAAGREIQAASRTALTDWLIAIDDIDETVDHGGDLVSAFDAKIFRNLDTGADETLWESWMSSGEFEVDGMVLRSAPDPAILFGKGADPLGFQTRNLVLAGDPLPRTRADQLSELLARMRPSRVKSDHPVVMLVWRDRQGHPVLEVAMPLNLKPHP